MSPYLLRSRLKIKWSGKIEKWSLSPNLPTDRTFTLEEQVNDLTISKEEEFAKNMVGFDFTPRKLSWI